MHIVIFITTKNKREANKIAKKLVAEKLIACANIVDGIQSKYWWQGKVCNDTEALMVIKSKKSLLTKITKVVKSCHSYSVPEIIALPIVGGNKDYLKWIDQSCK